MRALLPNVQCCLDLNLLHRLKLFSSLFAHYSHEVLQFAIMAPQKKNNNASIQAYLTPVTSPVKAQATNTPAGDGFTAEELQNALKPKPVEAWHPGMSLLSGGYSLMLTMLDFEYADMEISDLIAGPKAVTFMGRVANIFDVANSPKTPRSAKGCVKLCVKDGSGAITVRLWYAERLPSIRLGSLVSIWANHGQ